MKNIKLYVIFIAMAIHLMSVSPALARFSISDYMPGREVITDFVKNHRIASLLGLGICTSVIGLVTYKLYKKMHEKCVMPEMIAVEEEGIQKKLDINETQEESDSGFLSGNMVMEKWFANYNSHDHQWHAHAAITGMLKQMGLDEKVYISGAEFGYFYIRQYKLGFFGKTLTLTQAEVDEMMKPDWIPNIDTLEKAVGYSVSDDAERNKKLREDLTCTYKIHLMPASQEELGRIVWKLLSNKNIRKTINMFKVRCTIDSIFKNSDALRGEIEQYGRILPLVVIYPELHQAEEALNHIYNACKDLKGLGIAPCFNERVTDCIFCAQGNADDKVIKPGQLESKADRFQKEYPWLFPHGIFNEHNKFYKSTFVDGKTPRDYRLHISSQ